MANIKQALNTAGTATITIASLGSTAGRCSTAIDNSSNLFNSADIRLKVRTNASGTSTSGFVSVYLIRSEDGTNYDDNFGGTDAAITIVNATLIGYINTVANATTYQGVWDLAQLGLTLPAKWAIAIVNNSGAALDSTGGNHSLTYREKFATII